MAVIDLLSDGVDHALKLIRRVVLCTERESERLDLKRMLIVSIITEVVEVLTVREAVEAERAREAEIEISNELILIEHKLFLTLSRDQR